MAETKQNKLFIIFPCFCVTTEGGESHNGDDDSSESDVDEPSLTQETKETGNPSTGGGSQPGSATHRPRGDITHHRTLIVYTSYLY